MPNKILNSSKYEAFHAQSRPLLAIPKKTNFTYHLIFDFLDRHLPNKKLKVLDIGCGVGPISFYLANQNHQITGIDIAQQAIKSANQTKRGLGIRNVKFMIGDISQMKLTNSYDLIILSEVIEHIVDDKLLLHQISKYLNKNGRFIITTPSTNAPLYKLGLLNDFDQRVGHLRRYSPSSLNKLIVESGFKTKVIKPSEGILRNYLFTLLLWSWPMKAIQKFSLLGNSVTLIDNILVKLLGESNYLVLAQKS
ncbi:class I SAM-dependent methyltransferase [Patescibacteria group bacterium]|nr:class I SAM-dependent methyltransferase [Patescibacteria group bacterium]